MDIPTTDLPEAKFRRLDLFPAKVGDDTKDKRVIVTDSHMVVIGDSNSGPQIESVNALYDFTGSNKTGWVATTDGMEEIAIKRSSGCGCGSRLRGVRIYSTVPLRY